jgi:hypothetical protein
MMNGLRIGTVKAVGQGTEVRGVPGADGKTLALTNDDRARMRHKPGESGEAREVFVTAVVELLDEKQVIPKGPRGQITVNLTGARELALLPGLTRDDLAPADTKDAPILTTAAGDIADIQRSIQQLAEKVGTVADNANLVLADVRAAIADVRAKIAVIDLSGIQENVLAASSDLREALATTRRRIDEIAGRLADARGPYGSHVRASQAREGDHGRRARDSAPQNLVDIAPARQVDRPSTASGDVASPSSVRVSGPHRV